MSDTIYPAELFSPWSNNPLKTRADVEEALKSLARPVEAYRSPGGARIRLGSAAAHFDQASADMEGYSRLLWGLVPAAVGGADWIDWGPIAAGLANGCDPEHPEYWGDCSDRNQRLVELAAIGFALRLVPEHIWQPLTPQQQKTVASYLLHGHRCAFSDNNWMFFRLLLSMGLRHVGITPDANLDQDYIHRLNDFYLGDGWYQDGHVRRADHYIPFAFHFYGLLLAALDKGDWTQNYRERASLITNDISHWFADDGAALCFGRSMTYRFAIAGFWGATALIEDQTIPYGEQKGYYLRNLRWWARQPFASRDGILPVGYGYTNQMMSEPYNSPQSPYWAFKAFLPLMLPDNHPFWSATEENCPRRPQPHVQNHIGFVIGHPEGDAIALSSGQEAAIDANFLRCGAEKYSKFAYSARHGFSVEGDLFRFSDAVLNNMIGFSEDGRHYRVRESCEEARIADDLLYSRWRPYDDVTVETWLYWHEKCHIRIHRVESSRILQTTEGGFAIPRCTDMAVTESTGTALVQSGNNQASIIDLGSTIRREGRCLMAMPNTNLIKPQTVIPQLCGEIPAGTSILAVAVGVGKADLAEKLEPAKTPTFDLTELQHRISRDGRPVTLTLAR